MERGRSTRLHLLLKEHALGYFSHAAHVVPLGRSMQAKGGVVVSAFEILGIRDSGLRLQSFTKSSAGLYYYHYIAIHFGTCPIELP